MRKAYYLLLAFLAGVPLSGVFAECWVIDVRDDGSEILQCSSLTGGLPVCGSAFDTGPRCVVSRQSGAPYNRPGQNTAHPGRGSTLPGRGTSKGPLTGSAGAPGQTPYNAAGSWPNRAAEWQGK